MGTTLEELLLLLPGKVHFSRDLLFDFNIIGELNRSGFLKMLPINACADPLLSLFFSLSLSSPSVSVSVSVST